MLKLLIILLFTDAVRSTCPDSDQIHCATSDRCTRITYVCDGDNDCGDYSDEQTDLCNAWKNHDCSRGEVECYRGHSRDCISIRTYCDTSDPPCEGDLDLRICQILQNEKLQSLNDVIIPTHGAGAVRGGPKTNLMETITKGEDFAAIAKYTLNHDKCPLLYTRVGEECVSIFFFGSAVWGEARAFCQSVGGDLYVPTKHEDYITLVHHLSQHHLTADFWIGGSHQPETNITDAGWKWVTQEPIELGTPHWAIRHNSVCSPREVLIEHRNVTIEANDGFCYHYTQAPAEVPFGDCVAMTYDKFFFLSDEDCLLKKSPLCKLTKLTDSSHLDDLVDAVTENVSQVPQILGISL